MPERQGPGLIKLKFFAYFFPEKVTTLL